MAPTKTASHAKQINDLDDFYNYVKVAGKLRTVDHAKKWTRGTLNMLGVNIGGNFGILGINVGGAKKELAEKLPEELRTWLKEVFWLAHFRDSNLSSYEFQNRVARRSGNSDPQFAYFPVKAVFGGLKALIDENTSGRVADTLSPELREIWDNA